jgi:predicted dehydrogenase
VSQPKSIGWGVVGLGDITCRTMAPGIDANPHSHVAAAVSRSLGKAQEFVAGYDGARAYDSVAGLLRDPDVDVVFVGTPNAMHTDVVVAAAEAGKHVMCEKPMALTAAETLTQVLACLANDVLLGVNFHNRFMPWVARARDLVADGTIGEVVTVEATASFGQRGPSGWRDDPDVAGLGTIFGQGVHALDLIAHILDRRPTDVVALFDDENGRYQVETQALVLLRYPGGIHAYLNSNQRQPLPDNDFVIHGAQGKIVARGLTRSRFDGVLELHLPGHVTHWESKNPSGASHWRSIDAFVDAVMTQSRPPIDGFDGLDSMLLTDAITASVMDRRVVSVPVSERAIEDHARSTR